MNNQVQSVNSHNIYISGDVSSGFQTKAADTIAHLQAFSDKAKKAVDSVENIIILQNSDSYIPDEFHKTKNKLDKYASDAYGFVSKSDKAIVLIEQNHGRKNTALEGDVESQAEDTFTHEIGHRIDDEYSTTETFKNAYLQDLKNIKKLLDNPNSNVCGEDVHEMVAYLHHYTEGANFEDGIDETDITREGLRENFAECFSTIADTHPTKINEIYAALFPNTMRTTMDFVI